MLIKLNQYFTVFFVVLNLTTSFKYIILLVHSCTALFKRTDSLERDESSSSTGISSAFSYGEVKQA